MKTILQLIKSLVLCTLILSVNVVYAQNGSAYYKEQAKMHIENGNYDKAITAYGVYKEMTHKTDATIESAIKHFKETSYVNMYPMAYVAGGTFIMQNKEIYTELDKEQNLRVTLSPYYIGLYEVTQTVWQNVMDSNPSKEQGLTLPVTNISWYDCVRFCNELSRKTGLKECYNISDNGDVTLNINHSGYRLPTEAEWIFASKGGSKSQGYIYSGGNNISDVAWYIENSNSQPHTIGLLTPNELGIFDMTGNVWEWCWDWYSSYSNSIDTNPLGQATGVHKVYRGGAFSCDEEKCSMAQGSCPPSSSFSLIGLRLVRRP